MRDYGEETATIWGGDKDCEHEWYDVPIGGRNKRTGDDDPKFANDLKNPRGNSDLCSKCGAWHGQLGLEPTPELYIEHLRLVFAEVKRVLKKTGTCWVNIGDSYAGSGCGKNDYRNNNKRSASNPMLYCDKPSPQLKSDLPAKSMMMIPERFAFMMIDLGYILRNKIIWHKPNPMPSSVKDRFNTTYEMLYFFSKSRKYWFDLDAVRVSHTSLDNPPGNLQKERFVGDQYKRPRKKESFNMGGKNPGDFWSINTQPFPEAHFACVGEDTECLTINGWEKWNEIRRMENIATYNLEKQIIEYQPIWYIKEYDFNGELIHIGNRDLDILMTPNHRNVVLKKNGKEEIVLAENLAYGDKIRVRASIIYPENNGIGKTFAELIGWILAEGHYKKGGYIEIYQNEGANAKRIDYLLKKLEIPHTRMLRKRNYKGEIKEQVTWFLKKSPLIEWILQNIPNKELNRFLVSLPQEEIKVLFRGLIRGDGHIRKDDGRESFIQKSKECIDWFSILALRLGYHCIVSKRKDNGIYTAFLTKRTHIGVRKTNGKGKSITTEEYKGKVWCPKVKNGTWVARRNGRIFITGNTFPEKLVEKPILAGCPAEVCKSCGMARVRITKTIEDINNVPKEGWKRSYRGKVELTGSPQKRSVSELYKESLSKQRKTIGWTDCQCKGEDKYEPGIIIDPFGGSGTVGVVAERLGRNSILIDKKGEYCELSYKRLSFPVGQLKFDKEPSIIEKVNF